MTVNTVPLHTYVPTVSIYGYQHAPADMCSFHVLLLMLLSAGKYILRRLAFVCITYSEIVQRHIN